MSQTRGGKPTPVRNLDSPKPSKAAKVTRQPGAKRVSGGTGAARNLSRPTKPREKGLVFGETVANSNGFKNVDPIYASFHNSVDAPAGADPGSDSGGTEEPSGGE